MFKSLKGTFLSRHAGLDDLFEGLFEPDFVDDLFREVIKPIFQPEEKVVAHKDALEVVFNVAGIDPSTLDIEAIDSTNGFKVTIPTDGRSRQQREEATVAGGTKVIERTVPIDYDVSKMSSNCTFGMLRLWIPKRLTTESKSRKIKVTVD